MKQNVMRTCASACIAGFLVVGGEVECTSWGGFRGQEFVGMSAVCGDMSCEGYPRC